MQSIYKRSARRHLAPWMALLALGTVSAAWAQSAGTPAVTAGQRATAVQTASAGVPLSELAPNAPDEYTVRRGDTLWRISGLFLRSPWRWPELWGMNLNEIRNPHLIYPGQQLFLDKSGGRARLMTRRALGGQAGETIRVSPRNRVELLGTGPLPTLEPHLIEPFLAEPLVVDDDTFQRAPRIVATTEKRVLLSKGDRAYARGPADAPLLRAPGLPTHFRVFRSAKRLVDPVNGETLGYEGQYVGQAELIRGESETEEVIGATPARAPMADAKVKVLPVPATVDIVLNKEEMRTGDRLLPEPPRDFRSYVPRAPELPVEARVVAVYGNAVRVAGQNQIVAINKGLRDGLESGHVLAVLTSGRQLLDRTDGRKDLIKLPDERNGVAMVFRTFERVSYALMMNIADPVQVGDKLINPR